MIAVVDIRPSFVVFVDFLAAFCGHKYVLQKVYFGEKKMKLCNRLIYYTFSLHIFFILTLYFSKMLHHVHKYGFYLKMMTGGTVLLFCLSSGQDCERFYIHYFGSPAMINPFAASVKTNVFLPHHCMQTTPSLFSNAAGVNYPLFC